MTRRISRPQWELVRKPAGSAAELEDATSSRPGITPDVPGTYVSRLAVTDRRPHRLRYGRDHGAPADPVGPVDTAATVGGEPGIALGYHPDEEGGSPPQGPNEEFFPLGDGNALQLVVLDRETLETEATWAGPPGDGSIGELTSQLDGVEDDELVIVTAFAGSWGGTATEDLVANDGQGVEPIGALPQSIPQQAAYGLEHGGQHSWIGVPGFTAGDAWEIAGQGDVGLRGFLSPDNNDNYAYMAPEPTTYDLGPDGQAVSVQLGDGQPYEGSLPDGQGGFLVAYVDALTLEPANVSGVPSGGRTYQTRNADGSPNTDGMFAMAGDLQNAAGQGFPLLVAIRSIGPAPLAQIGEQPPKYEGELDFIYEETLDFFVQQVAGVGGHGQAIWGMATKPTGQDSYSLLGSNYAASGQQEDPEGTGTDIGSQVGPQPQTQLSGVLARDKDSRYVAKVTTDQPVDATLAELSLAEPVEWPLSQTAGQRAAIACIGNAQGLGPDPRVAYWTQTYDAQRWASIQTAISAMLPSACPNVDEADFTSVRDELAQEVGWLLNVQSYLGALTSPFSSSGLSSFADLQSITNEVVDAVNPPPPKPAGIDAWAVLGDHRRPDRRRRGAVRRADRRGLLPRRRPDLAERRRPDRELGRAGRVRLRVDGPGAGPAAPERRRLERGARRHHRRRLRQAQHGRHARAVHPRPVRVHAGVADHPGAAARLLARAGDLREAPDLGRDPAGGLPVRPLHEQRPGVLRRRGTFEGPQEQIFGVGCDFYPPFSDANGNPIYEPVFLRYGVRVVTDTTFMVFSQQNFRGGDDNNKARARATRRRASSARCSRSSIPAATPTRAASRSISTRS